MEEGKPIWVESILSDKEYSDCSKLYPKSFSKGSKKIQMFDCDFKWRYCMGYGYDLKGIETMNSRIEQLRKLLKK